ncbi:hypothetical protein C8J57DRAFT_1111005 [Mycena rebaudengoi]|nr:hypothetical protein C8J57DRAFT_1111005 [Mycena rebaudengoi]
MDDTKKQRDDDPSEKMWSIYMNEVDRHNRVLVECWKADMNSILIFAGLFSASVTTFIVESYKTLGPPDPRPNQETLALVLQLILSQTNGSNITIPPSLLNDNQTPFVPSASALICNTLLFLSLACSLVCALSATLVDQWARNYILATESRPSLHKRARISAYLYRGIRRFRMNTVVEAIPTLLHISLLLFFAALILFLRPINAAISNLMLGVLIFCGCLYALVTFLPLFYSNCPYQTPLSSAWFRIFRSLGFASWRANGSTVAHTFESMAEARDSDATVISQERDERDFEAMHWTLTTLREDTEIIPFLGFIPQIVGGFDYSAKLLLHRLLNHGDPTIGLRYRVPLLLGSCAEGHLTPALAHSRSTTCLHAIWSLTMMAVPLSVPFTPSSRATLSFDEQTLNYIRAVRGQIPSVADCAGSTASVVARSLLDMFVDMASGMEENLRAFLQSGYWLNTARTAERDPEWAYGRSPQVTKRVEHQMRVFSQLLLSGEEPTAPVLYVVAETIRQYLDDLIEVAIAMSGESVEDARSLADHALESVGSFQRLLNEVGFSLTLEYISTLVKSHSLPHEAFNTLRRLFLKVNFDSRNSACPRFPPRRQLQLVGYLDEALEQNPSRGSRLPASVVNILLGMTVALDDGACAMKARGVVNNYLNSSSSAITRDAAVKATSHLDSILPVDARSTPILELYSSHMYANTKLERRRTEVAGHVIDHEAALLKLG